MSQTHQMSEEGMCLEVPTVHWCKLDEKLDAQRLASLFSGFKLVDFAWTDGQTLWLIEFKRYYDETNPKYREQNLEEERIRTNKIEELFKKTICAALLFNPHQKKFIEAILPSGVDSVKNLKIVHLVKVRQSQEYHLTVVKQAIERKLADYKIEIGGLFVMSYDSQREILEGAMRP